MSDTLKEMQAALEEGNRALAELAKITAKLDEMQNSKSNVVTQVRNSMGSIDEAFKESQGQLDLALEIMSRIESLVATKH